MVGYCVAFGCKNKAKKGGPSFHKFPSDSKILEQWLSVMKRKDFKPSKYSRICSDHFEEKDFIFNFGRKLLKKDVIPSNFNIPSSIPSLPQKEELSQRSIRIENRSEICHSSRASTSKSTEPSQCIESGPSVESSVEPQAEPSTSQNLKVADLTMDNTTVSINVPIKSRKRKCPVYFGDFKMEDVDEPLKARKFFTVAKSVVHKQKKVIKYLNNRNRNLKKQVRSLHSLLKHLQERLLITQDSLDILKETIPQSEKQLLTRQLKGSKTSKYPPELRSFALTLHFYSVKAYKYVRKTFSNCLPHESTIRKWYTSIDGSPGYTSEAINAVKIKVNEMFCKNQELVCALMMDEMSIKEHVHWNGKKMVGYVDYGLAMDNDNLPTAKEVLVFMIVALNQKWKIPIGYFLLNGLAAEQRANLISGCFHMLRDTGVKVKALTFDGAASNIAAVKLLGGNIYWPDLLPFLNISQNNSNSITSNEKIHLILDPAHMIKLCRNTLGDWGFLFNQEGKKIEWKYFELLVSLQESVQLHAANKIRKRHLNYPSEKMKVKLAVQVFSNSVADALIYCKDTLKLDQFKDCGATIEFCQKLNNIFDVLNTRNYLNNQTYKRPMSQHNKQFLFNFIQDSVSYLSSLKDMHGNSLIHSNRKIGFLGLILSLTSVKNLYLDLVDKNIMKYLSTYKLSQDHLEMFFSAIRSRGGFNNNPTAYHFQSAYKKLLIHTEIASIGGNCVAQDNTSILHVGSGSTNNNSIDIIEEIQNEDDKADEIMLFTNLHHLQFAMGIVEYIAGFIVSKLKKNLDCMVCCNALIDSERSSLISVKTRGGLSTPSKDVFLICKVAEIEFKICDKSTFNLNFVTLKCMRKLGNNIFSTLENHIIDQEPLAGHDVQLTYLILKKYLTLRINYFAKSVEPCERVRHKFTKLILFKNQ